MNRLLGLKDEHKKGRVGEKMGHKLLEEGIGEKSNGSAIVFCRGMDEKQSIAKRVVKVKKKKKKINNSRA